MGHLLQNGGASKTCYFYAPLTDSLNATIAHDSNLSVYNSSVNSVSSDGVYLSAAANGVIWDCSVPVNTSITFGCWVKRTGGNGVNYSFGAATKNNARYYGLQLSQYNGYWLVQEYLYFCNVGTNYMPDSTGWKTQPSRTNALPTSATIQPSISMLRDGTLVLMNGAASWQANGSYLMDYRGKSVLFATTWKHVAIVGNDNGHNYMYIDGVKKTGDGFETCTNLMSMANGKIKFGNIALNMNRFFRGYMEEIRLSNVVRYTDNFTPQSYR